MEKDNIAKYINDLPEKLDQKKSISLFKAIKLYCPNTIKLLNKKIENKNIISHRKWYTAVINYLVKKEILTTEKTDLGTFHNVEESYIKYFIIPKSPVYSLNNADNHLILYKQTIKEFLIEAGLLNQEGKEIIEKPQKDNFEIKQKEKKVIKIISIILLIYTILQFIILITKYGFKQYIPLLMNTILLIIAILGLIKEK